MEAIKLCMTTLLRIKYSSTLVYNIKLGTQYYLKILFTVLRQVRYPNKLILVSNIFTNKTIRNVCRNCINYWINKIYLTVYHN